MLAVVIVLSGCEPMSEYAEGREDAVRYALPRGAMQILEHADHLELLAIERSEDWHDEGSVWYEDLDANTLVRVPLLRVVDCHAAVAALYRGIGQARGTGLCFHPHHALRATRGDEVLIVVVCLSCLQARVGAGQTFVALDPGAVDSVWTPLIEARSGVRFEPERDSFGRWVERE